MRISCLALLWSFGMAIAVPAIAETANVPLPKQIYSVSALFEEIRQPLKRKLDELTKNYAARLSPPGKFLNGLNVHNQTVYFAEDFRECVDLVGTIRVQPRSQLAALDHTSSLNPEKTLLTELVRGFGCRSDTPLLKETITSRGKNLQPPTWESILVGGRPMSLAPNEDSRLYELTDNEGKKILRVSSVKTASGATSTEYSVFGQKILVLDESPGPQQSTATYEIFPFQMEVNRRGNGIRASHNIRTTFTVQVDARGVVRYFEGGVIPLLNTNSLSYSDFQKKFQSQVLSMGIAIGQMVVKNYMDEFPNTEVVFAGTKSSRVLEEFNLARTRAEANDLLYVKDFLNRFIDYLDKGLIVITDKRP